MYSPSKYEKLITSIKNLGYQFFSFEETDCSGKRVYLRHDIEYSILLARKMARLNSELGISASFGFRLRANSYNLFSPLALEIIKEIDDLGQYVTFHFDMPDMEFDKLDEDELYERLKQDFNVTKRNIESLRPVFSWHNPGGYPEIFDEIDQTRVEGLINIYSRRFFKDIPYISDSSFDKSFNEFLEIFEESPEEVHLLIHPFWWLDGDSKPLQSICNDIKYVIRACEHDFINNLYYGRVYPEGMPSSLLKKFVKELGGNQKNQTPVPFNQEGFGNE